MKTILLLLLFVLTNIFCGKLCAQNGKRYQEIGDSLYAAKNYQQAADNYTRGMPFFKNSKKELSGLYDSRSQCERRQEQYTKALDDANQAILLDNQNGSAYWARANVHGDQNEYKLAIADYTSAMPFYQDDHENLAILYDNRADEKLNIKDFKGAIADDSVALKLDQKNGDAYWHQGIAYKNLGAYQHAADDYSAAMIFEEDDTHNLAQLYDNRGGCKRYLKKYLDAINDESYAINLNPDNGYYFWNRASAYADNGDYELAVDDYTKALSFFKDDNANLAILYNNCGFNEIRAVQPQKAIDDFNKAISLNPGNGMFYWFRGIAFSSSGDFKAGIADYTKALPYYQAKPKILATLYNECGNDAYFLMDYQSAIDNCTKAILNNPGYPSAYYYRAKAFNKSGKKEAAVADFKKVLELDTNKSSVNFWFALFYTGEYDRAVKGLQQKILSTTNNFEILGDYYNMACLLSLMNKPQEANIYLKKAIDGGYPKNYALADDDLSNLRKTTDFIDLMAENTTPK